MRRLASLSPLIIMAEPFEICGREISVNYGFYWFLPFFLSSCIWLFLVETLCRVCFLQRDCVSRESGAAFALLSNAAKRSTIMGLCKCR